jgi:hypothetical protein
VALDIASHRDGGAVDGDRQHGIGLPNPSVC